MPVLVMLFHYVSFPAADRRRLCYQQPLAGFTPATFSALILAFIQQAREMQM
ncbi:hypothetical protein FB99_13870 [Pantoea agglomerans]|jgi:hypothetical protein|nr:hypothetical protein FB99_13870 [Pantoea agglomerans]